MTGLVGALEHASEHPIARAIAAYSASGTLIEVEDFTGLAGRGVSGTVDGRVVFAGRPEFAAEIVGVLPASVQSAVDEAQDAGATAIVAGWDGTLRAVIAVSDRVRSDGATTVAQLHALGLDVVLLTGDNVGAAEAAASAADTVA